MIVCVTVLIAFNYTYQEGWGWASLSDDFESIVDSYFEELIRGWADSPSLVVRASQLEARFLDIPGVIDVQNTTINGSGSNLVLSDRIPVRGAVNG
ncbi:MAG: hypothetical protein LBL35_02055 [Clostridiales bacterium]|jgi:hypothetical protein|nr:hypothetical protein [Clostridiales bacterium]